MADDHDGAALRARELGDQRVDEPRARGVELACRLVGEQQPRPVGERGADRDALLLAAGELAPGGRRAFAQSPTRSSSSSARASRSARGTPARAGWSATSSRAVSSGASARS